MKHPNFNLEKSLIKQGFQNIVGIDEVGRGAWAGPLVAVATRILKPEFRILKTRIKDSKLISEKVREAMFEKLSKKVVWSYGIVTHREIDKLGLTRANVLAIKRALRDLEIEPDYLLIDSVNGFKHRLPHQLIVKGDRKILSISIASILAKVTRDRMMRDFHQKYPQYHFSKHKGYGTKLHQKCLSINGTCRIHRQSYEPIKKLAF